MALILSRHLAPGLDKRRLRLAFIEATVTNPEWTMADPFRLGVTRSFRAIPEFGNRVLMHWIHHDISFYAEGVLFCC
jgi:hypothetical protein